MSEIDSEDIEQQKQEDATVNDVEQSDYEELEDEPLKQGQIPLFNPLQGEGDFKDILSFDDLDNALMEQPALYAYYGEAAARAQRQYAKAKQNTEHVEARAAHILRSKWNVKIDGKMTEKALDTKIKMSTAYRNALECQNDAQFIQRMCTNVHEAFNQREQMIIQACKRAEVEMFSTGAYKGKFNDKKERNEHIRKSLKKSSTLDE